MWQITPTIDLVELTFTALALIAFYYHRQGVMDAFRDLAVLRESKRNSALTLIAEQNVRDDEVMGGVQLVFAVLGSWAMFQPIWWPVVATVPVLLLLGAQGALVYLSWARRRVRWKLDELSRKNAKVQAHC